jgi:hypothetical protein
MVRRRRPLILPSVAAVAAVSLLAAGCGGGSPGVASVASSATAATTATQSGATATPNGRVAAALALARCMRSHGVPKWPDPDSTGGFDKSKLRQLAVSSSRMRALQDGPCNIPIPSGGQSQGQTITPADRADYLKAAACMRSHGVPDFPDPTFQNNNVSVHIPSSIDPNSSVAKRASATCKKLIPAGLPYSGSSAP